MLYKPCKALSSFTFLWWRGRKKGGETAPNLKKSEIERERERAREKEREELTGVALHCVSSMGLALENSFPAQLA